MYNYKIHSERREISKISILLAVSIFFSIVAGVRAEFEAREKKLKETYARKSSGCFLLSILILRQGRMRLMRSRDIDNGDVPTTRMLGKR